MHLTSTGASMSSLFADDKLPTKPPRVSRVSSRRQYRCQLWEKHCRPQVFATDLAEPAQPILAEVSIADLRDHSKDLTHILTACRDVRAAEYERRYTSRQPFQLQTDAVRLVDYIKSLTLLGEALWEDALAARGLRSCVKGIHKVVSGSGVHQKTRWRVRPWCPNTQRHVTGLDDCYRDTRGEAKERLIGWWKEERNIDISYKPPVWLVDALYEAHRELSRLAEAVGGIGFDVEPDWSDDEPPEPKKKKRKSVV